jgi:hypothetical protein
VLILCTWWRVPGDNQLNPASLDERVIRGIFELRMMHIAGLIPALALMWLQISVLAAVSVAISTRVSLVVNLPVVIMLYIAGNLTRFLFPLTDEAGGPLAGRGPITKGFAYIISLLLPYLETFDLRHMTVYSRIALAGTQFADDFQAVSLGAIWQYTGMAALYAIAYAAFALTLGMLLFQTRELGGAEG